MKAARQGKHQAGGEAAEQDQTHALGRMWGERPGEHQARQGDQSHHDAHGRHQPHDQHERQLLGRDRLAQILRNLVD